MKNKQNNLIVKHNKLIEAKYKLSLQEQKLILILASRINKDDENFNKQVFSVIELAEILGINKDWYYSEIKEVTKKLINRVIEIRKGNKFLQVAFLEYAEYLEDEGTVELQFSSKLKSYFLQLKNNFTKYYLKNVIKFESIYSIRIYELLKQYERIKSRKFEIEKLKEILGIENKYSRYYDFKKRILFQAQEEINEKSDLEIDFEELKTGRKVTAIKFMIKKKKNPPKELRFKENIEKQEYSSEVLELFELLPKSEQIESNKKELSNLLEEHSLKYLKADIDYAKKTQPDNFMGFLKTSCAGGHYSTAKLEKKAKEEELAKQRKQEQKKKEDLERKIKEKAQQKAKEKYQKLSTKEIASYAKGYETLPKMLKEKVSKEEFVLGAIEEEVEKDLKELSELIM